MAASATFGDALGVVAGVTLGVAVGCVVVCSVGLGVVVGDGVGNCVGAGIGDILADGVGTALEADSLPTGAVRLMSAQPTKLILNMISSAALYVRFVMSYTSIGNDFFIHPIRQ
ncbi:hypothetical protein D3C85_1480710 [compost metagenome]